MLFDPARHEPLRSLDWDADAVRASIQHLVGDAESQFDPVHFWPAHPRDRKADAQANVGLTPLYHGACGVAWALHYLRDVGAAKLQSDYIPYLDAARSHNQAWLGEVADAAAASYMMGDTPFLMMQWAQGNDSADLEERLTHLIAGNMDHPHRELMWGAPGTLLAALFLHARSGDARWAELFVQTAATLWSRLLWSEEFQCHYWMQDLYGRECTYLDGVHGFVATAFVLIKGRHLLAPQHWAAWEHCIEQTMARTATEEGALVNWRAQLFTAADEKPRLLMQFCHGAPGFVICLAELPGPALDALLLRAGEAIWAAGPLTKGANLCHGTGGNGYAFLKLYQRTGDALWLQRARAFAMHGMAQTTADRAQYGQGQYSLWTGDLGFAVYLWDCLTGEPRFPTLDVFFAP
jgi:hypothetical protein